MSADAGRAELLKGLLDKVAMSLTQPVGGSGSPAVPGRQISPQGTPQVPLGDIEGQQGLPTVGQGPQVSPQQAIAAPVAPQQFGTQQPIMPPVSLSPSIPTSFGSRKERDFAVGQQAVKSLGNAVNSIVQRSNAKKASQAEAVATIILTKGESLKNASSDVREGMAKKVEGMAPKIQKMLRAIDSGDLQEIAKHAGTPEWQGVQAAMTKVTNAREQARTQQEKQQQMSMDVAKMIQENQVAKAQINQLTAEAEALRSGAQAPLPQTVDVVVDGKPTTMQLNKETGKYDIPIGEVPPVEPMVYMKNFEGVLPSVKGMGEIPRSVFPAVVSGLFNRMSEEEKMKWQSKENQLDRKNDEKIASMRTSGTLPPFLQLPPEVRAQTVDWAARQLTEPDGITKYNEVTAGDSGLKLAVNARLAEVGADLTKMESGTKQIMDSSKSMTLAIDSLLKKMSSNEDRYREVMGPLSSRWSTALTEGLGAGADPEAVDLITTVSMIASGTMRAHVGLRGGQMLLERFDNLLGAKFMDYDTLTTSLKAMKNFLNDNYVKPYEGRGGGTPTETPQTRQEQLRNAINEALTPQAP